MNAKLICAMVLIMQKLGLSGSASVIRNVTNSKDYENIHMDLGSKLCQRRGPAITE